jgi:Fe-S-cluster containining protein
MGESVEALLEYHDSETVDSGVGCVRCGKCCVYPIELSRSDISRIKGATGLEEEEFVVIGLWRQYEMMKTEYDREDRKLYCVFLKKVGDGTTYCDIYDDRPSVCRHHGLTAPCRNSRTVHDGLLSKLLSGLISL